MQLDVADPEFRQYALAHSAAIVDTCARLYQAASKPVSCAPTPTYRRSARHTLVCLTGALQVWAVNDWGSLHDFLTDQLDLTIAPYLAQE